MKKQVIAFLLLLVIGAQVAAHFGYTKVQAGQSKVIPNEAIRLRILANSDSEEDQALKRKVRDRVKGQIDTWVADLRSFEDARRVIQSRLPELEQTVAQTLQEEGSKQRFTVEFGKHVKFPTKVYGNFIYPAGEYEAVLVKLGEGEGANWWCVLFPPLCFLDFSSGTAVRNEEQVVQAAAATPIVEEEPVEAPLEVEVPEQTTVAEQAAAPKEEEQTQVVEEAQVVAEPQEAPIVDNVPEPVKIEVTEIEEEEEVQVKFFLVELVSSFFS